MTDWTKPIYEETSHKPAKFIGFSSQGSAVVEYCSNLYFVNVDSGIRAGNMYTTEQRKKQIRFINVQYKYKPFESYSDVIPFVGTEIIDICDGKTYEILGVWVGRDNWSVGIGNSKLIEHYESSSYLRNVFIFKNTKEPVGKKVLVT